MQVKLLEIRDRATFIPVMAVSTEPINEQQRYLLGRAGYHGDPQVVVTRIAGGNGKSTCDPYDWDSSTMVEAHKYIIDNWHTLINGSVVDVEFILGHSKTPKISERYTP